MARSNTLRLLASVVLLSSIAVLQANGQIQANLPSYINPLSTIDQNNKTIQWEYPQYDAYNPLKYIPSLPLAIVATVLYALTSLAVLLLMLKWGQKFMLTIIVGSICYSFGMAVRIWFRQDTHKGSSVYVILYLFTTLSPCALLACDYVLLGRIVRHLGMDKHLAVKAQRTTAIFVGSDVITFCVQAIGGGMATNRDVKAHDTGTKVFLAGIILQMISFVFFTCISLHFLYKVRKHEPQLWSSGSKEDRRWKHLYFAMLWTCIGFLIRSFFRTVELSEGFGGHLSIHEVYVFALDVLPIFLAIIIYIPFYPGKYLRPSTAGAHPYAYHPETGALKKDCKPEPVLTEDEKMAADAEAAAGKKKKGWKRLVGGRRSKESAV